MKLEKVLSLMLILLIGGYFVVRVIKIGNDKATELTDKLGDWYNYDDILAVDKEIEENEFGYDYHVFNLYFTSHLVTKEVYQYQDNVFFLNHNGDGKYDPEGSLFLDKGNLVKENGAIVHININNYNWSKLGFLLDLNDIFYQKEAQVEVIYPNEQFKYQLVGVYRDCFELDEWMKLGEQYLDKVSNLNLYNSSNTGKKNAEYMVFNITSYEIENNLALVFEKEKL